LSYCSIKHDDDDDDVVNLEVRQLLLIRKRIDRSINQSVFICIRLTLIEVAYYRYI